MRKFNEFLEKCELSTRWRLTDCMIHDSHTVVRKDTERESVAAGLTRHEVPVIYDL